MPQNIIKDKNLYKNLGPIILSEFLDEIDEAEMHKLDIIFLEAI